MQVTATAKNIRVSPKKVRLILKELPGKTVGEAMAMLRYVPQPSARKVAKVVRSAAANAENNYDLDVRTLRIVAAYADPGIKLRRFRPRPRGRVGIIRHRYSHITVIVEGQ